MSFQLPQLRCSNSWISSNFGSNLMSWTNCGKVAMFDGDSLDLAKISLDMAVISPDLAKISLDMAVISPDLAKISPYM